MGRLTRSLVCVSLGLFLLACTGEGAPATPATPATAPSEASAATPAASAQSTPATLPAVTPTPVPGAEAARTAPALAPAQPAVAAAPATSTPTPKPSVRPAPISLDVTLETRDLTFEPHQIHGNFDDTINVTLRGSDERHSFTVPVAGIDQVIEKDRTVTVSFVLPLALGGPTAEGTFAFYCRFHGTPTSGMHGFLIFH